MNVHSRDLRYFVTIAEELHFTKAAERLFISQPALSKQIRLLEKTLGTALFERDRRSVRLTAAGTTLGRTRAGYWRPVTPARPRSSRSRLTRRPD
ncbi:LysR family transcriptional regulator [Nocardia miyunensis]|uniref:LysR family transcriptional regulator n=1 Tax=Nocardia miyunensis TaxID=282684 RepID=UPI00082C0267|nr:LysR family transcriptional regulator [Nocardia miyunensis]